MTVAEANPLAQSNPTVAPAEPWASIEAGAQHAAISPETLREWIKRGFVRAARVGRVWRVRLSEIDAFLIQGGGAHDTVASRARAAAKSFAPKGGFNG